MGNVVHISALTFDPRNARKHTPRNIGMIQESLQRFGPLRGIVIDEDNVILAGNGVAEAAIQAGIERVRVIDFGARETITIEPDTSDEPAITAIRVSHLTEEDKRLYAVADNRAGELSEWDTAELAALQDAGADLSTMWFDDELAALLTATPGDPGGAEPEAPDAFPAFDDDIDTEYCCPKCGYSWSGKPK